MQLLKIVLALKRTTKQILWPILGAGMGFVSLWLIPIIWVGVASDRVISALTHSLLLMLVTALGAFAGGWAAFSAERRTQKLNKLSAQVSASNKSIFQIARLYLICANLNEQFIIKHRNDEMRAVHIDSPPQNIVTRFHFAFDELSFLLDFPDNSEAPNVLFELVRLEDNFNILVETIDMRADAIREFAAASKFTPLIANVAVDIKAMPEYRKLNAMTDGMITGIDETMAASIRMYKKLHAVLKQQFPRETFVKWDYTVKLSETL